MGFICTALKGSLELALGVIIWLASHYWHGKETWTKILDITTNRLTVIVMLSGNCYLDFLKLCVCVWICIATYMFWTVCITVNKHSMIGIADIWITHHRFGLESPNLHQTCILEHSYLVLKMEVIDIDLHDHLGHFRILGNLACPHDNFNDTRITKCIFGLFQLLLKMGVIDLWPSRSFGHLSSRISIQRLSCILI